MKRIAFVLVSLLAALANQHASACAVCFGDPESAQTHGMNAAIFTMLGVTWTVLGLFALTGFMLWRRAVAGAPDEYPPAGESVPPEEGARV